MDEKEKIRISGDVGGFHKLVLEGMIAYLGKTTANGEEYKHKVDELYTSIIQRGLEVLNLEASQNMGKDFLREVDEGFPTLERALQAGKPILERRVDGHHECFLPGAFLITTLKEEGK